MNKIVWQPTNPENSRMWEFMRLISQKYSLSFANYQELHSWSIQNPALFWQAICDYFGLTFNSPPKKIINNYQHMIDARWFEGATFNFTEKILARNDLHPALISINETGTKSTLSYFELRHQVARCAGGLKKLGVTAEDRVAAVMPNVSFTIIAMLATASLGAIWSSCSSEFGAAAIIDRLGQIQPKILFIGDGHQYLGKEYSAAEKINEIVNSITSLTKIIICPIISKEINFQLKNKTFFKSWDKLMEANHFWNWEPYPFAHPLYILYSSGTTGKPKCIVHSAGGTLIQHLKELGLHTDLKACDNLFFYTTCGWMMWNWMISSLALGATLTIYEGAPTYPNVYRLFEIIENENVSVFGTSAKYLTTIAKEDANPRKYYSLKKLRTILGTGSPLIEENYNYVAQFIKTDVQLSSISGGTDLISCFALGNPLLPVYEGELQCLGLGMAVEIYDDKGKAVKEQKGELVCTKAFPSMPIYFWQDSERKKYFATYFSHFPNVWTHGDFAKITTHNGLIIYGRSDLVLNPGGVRIGTAEIYRQIAKIPEILSSVVIGQNWQNDTRIVLFVQLKKGLVLDAELEEKIRTTIRYNASPRHVPTKILAVKDLPITLNGKIMEIAVIQAINGEEITNISSIANPASLAFFKNRKELQS